MIPEPSSDVPLEKDYTYRPEIWTWFAVGIIVLALRWMVRLHTVGLRGLEPDDYLTVWCATLWTVNALIVETTYFTGSNVDVVPTEAPTLSAHDVEVLTYGSIWEFVSWYTYPGLIWTLKFQVLFFYKRLSLDVIKPLAVNTIFVLTALAYVALVLTISLSCRPTKLRMRSYQLNWQIDPLPGPECTFRSQNFWTLVVLNVVTDLAIMSIPAPYLLRLRISWGRKVGVSLLILSGIFMIATAVVRAVQTLGGAPSVININRWGFRETGVGMIAVNAAVLLPMLRRQFWRRGSYMPRVRAEPPPQEARQRRPTAHLKVLAAVWIWTESIISRTTSSFSQDVNPDRTLGTDQTTARQEDVEIDSLQRFVLQINGPQGGSCASVSHEALRGDYTRSGHSDPVETCIDGGVITKSQDMELSAG